MKTLTRLTPSASTLVIIPVLAMLAACGSSSALESENAGLVATHPSDYVPATTKAKTDGMQVVAPATTLAAAATAVTAGRDPLKQPFASNSIWNMPIGRGAIYKPANLSPTPGGDIPGNWAPIPGADEEFIFMNPTARSTPVYYNGAGWSGADRCAAQGSSLVDVPMPGDFVIPHGTGNNGAAFLALDNRTVIQVQPLTRCSANGYATALRVFPNVDLYGDGRSGAHGGSALSSLGGSIRMGELRPGQQGMRHALKINVFAAEALYNCSPPSDPNEVDRVKDCYRWPASTADTGSLDRYGTASDNKNVEMKMGALLAIPASVDLNSLGLQTEPGRQIAWTLQNYGGYIVDDTGAPGFFFSTEWSPAGRKIDEFQRDYQYAFMQKIANASTSPWLRDIQRIMKALNVVSNNSATSIGGGGTPLQPPAPPLQTRDPLKQPFASTSIWNMPIGSNAQYVAANMSGNPGNTIWALMPGVDDEKIVLTPTAPMTALYASNAGWTGKDRCPATGALLLTVPMPSNYVVPNSTGNNSAAFLMADKRTIVQTQPLARCSAGAPGTSMTTHANVDLYGPGITGSHGGSGLSALGGSIRLGELRPGMLEGPHHALKVAVYAKEALYRCTTGSDCYRWPAVTRDSYAVGWYGTANNNGNAAMKMGALLAIPYSTSIASLNLETAVAKQLAWTLQNYGAYIVDDTYAPGFMLDVESGPAGDKRAEFQADWGFSMVQKVADNTAWRRDMQKLVQALYVVNNNTPTTIGGGGTPRQPLAPPIAP
jgi:hypothetical protein